jgi:hypothetical protein
MRYNRFLPILVPFLSFLLLELYYFRTKTIYLVLVFLLLFFFFTCRQFVLGSSKKEKWYNLFILPVIFTVGLVLYTTMIQGKIFIQMLIFLNIAFLYYYFRSSYYFLIKTESYREGSMENFSAYGNFLSVYFISSSIYGLQSFLNFSVWQSMVVLILVISITIYQVFWANKIDWHLGLFYGLLLSLVLLEISWSVAFLTLSYYILGLMVAICYYVIIDLVKNYLLNKLDRRTVKMYLIFGFFSIIIVLLTARWI